MHVIPAQSQHAPAIAECLRDIARRDLFLSHQQHTQMEDVWLALDQNTIAGLGWTSQQQRGTELDIRVLPQFRNLGVGRMLFNAITKNLRQPWLASCDAAQARSIEFLTRRNFTMDGAVYAMRWDGQPEDVPPSFKSADITETMDIAGVQRLFEHSYDGHWLQPKLANLQLDEDAFILVARIQTEMIGAALVQRSADTLVLTGLCTHRDYRQRGVGRGLLCALMMRAGQCQLGLVTRVDSSDEVLQQWGQRLGFWSYRTWLYFSRADGHTGAAGQT
ncbi:MAG: GNAT family N-acetyltransferase [Myxococcota bacterium]|nr:GNAT family N-acetyltransferase [Myxococcota bacterium]